MSSDGKVLDQNGLNKKPGEADSPYAAPKLGIPASSGIEPVLSFGVPGTLSSGPSGVYNAPSGAYSQPSMYNQPSGAYSQPPASMFNQPSGMYNQPSGAYSIPSGIMGVIGSPEEQGSGVQSIAVRYGSIEDAEISQNYDVGEQLGRGAQAIVYEAWRKTDRMHCVIKVMQVVGYDDNEAHVAIKRFFREAELISSLNEEHIVKCLDYGRFEGAPCMVLEFVEGLSLDKLLSQYGALPLQYATGIIDQLLQALVETHKKSIIHRDIKPGNIMVFDSPPPYVIRVLDFGISSVLDGLQSQTLMTQAGNVRGTPSYMAPELFTGETRASVESDLYAVGLVYLECLTGEVAVSDKSFMRVAYKQVNEELEIPGFIPQGIADIILKLCAKPINQRYHSATDVLEEIHAKLPKALKEEEKCAKEWTSSGGKVVRKSTDSSSVSLSTGQFSLSNPKVLIGILLLGAIGVFILVFALSHSSEEDTITDDPNSVAIVVPDDENKKLDETDNEEDDEHKRREKAITDGILILNQAWSNADAVITKEISDDSNVSDKDEDSDKSKEKHHKKGGKKGGKGNRGNKTPNGSQPVDIIPNFF